MSNDKMKNKDKKIKELERENVAWIMTSVIVGTFFILQLVISIYVFNTYGHPVDLNQQLQSCQEKIPNDLQYRYNYTKCVFENKDGDSVVCNLVMRKSCSEINKIDQNCEVVK